MELYFKQRLLSFFDSFDIYDEDDNVIYTVEGQPAWLHKLHVLNAAGEHIATVRQELSLLASLELLVGEQSIGCVEQNFSLLRSSFTLDCYDWATCSAWTTASRHRTAGAWRHFPRSCSTGRIPTISPSRVRRMSFRPC